MFERIQRFVDRIESRISLWQILNVAGLLSSFSISAKVAAVTEWLQDYAPASWWFGGLLGSFLFMGSIWLISRIRREWISARASRKWSEQVDSFNPLASEFSKLRIAFRDLFHPLDKRIIGKRFIDCELIGPANIAFYKDCDIKDVQFLDCDIVQLKPDATVQTVYVMEDIKMIGCKIYRTTIFVPPWHMDKMAIPGANIITPYQGPTDYSQSTRDTE